MNTLKEIILIKFANEIRAYEKYKDSILSNGDNIEENIDMICNALENDTINEDCSNEHKRSIFDRGVPCTSLKMIWFVCAHEDNLNLFKWASNGLAWLKGSEKNNATLHLQDYVKEYKPQQITQWLIGQPHENKEVYAILQNISPYLLYAVEGKEKKLQHQLVSRSTFRSNSNETYEFLKQTQDEHLFNKIMKKHFNLFKFYKNNVILKESDKDIETKFFSYYFDENDAVDKLKKIKNFREMNFNNIADYINSYELNKTLQECLSVKDLPKRKIKI